MLSDPSRDHIAEVVVQLPLDRQDSV
jgi:hypothetical protein